MSRSEAAYSIPNSPPAADNGNKLGEAPINHPTQQPDVNAGELTTMQNLIEESKCSDVCPVCLDEVKQATTLNCKHSFCNWCIERWIGIKQTCPLCRAIITDQSYTAVSLRGFVLSPLEPEAEEEEEENRLDYEDWLTFQAQLFREHFDQDNEQRELYLEEIEGNYNTQLMLELVLSRLQELSYW